MPINKKCEICSRVFHPKPANVKKGWGRFCSAKCQYQSFKNGVFKKCSVCNKEVYLTPSRFENSKSGKFFCDKSCQTKWRNTEFIGSKHANFKDGSKTYQTILKRHKVPQICAYCREKDVRVLATHHVDENHKNNDINNLVWLCHNCHLLVHYDKVKKLFTKMVQQDKFFRAVLDKLMPVI